MEELAQALLESLYQIQNPLEAGMLTANLLDYPPTRAKLTRSLAKALKEPAIRDNLKNFVESWAQAALWHFKH